MYGLKFLVLRLDMSIIFAILIFSFLIFIHEFGHFITAKLSGVQVNEFSMFMGPAIWKKQKGETLYSIRCIPIGGYCAMEGEDGDSDNPRAFGRAAWWKRLIILVAGAAFNFVAGLLLVAVVYAPAEAYVAPVISHFEEFATVDDYGLQLGDRILEIDGRKVLMLEDVGVLLQLNEGDYHDIVVERDGQRVELNDFYLERHKQIQDGNEVMLCGFSYGQVEEFTFASKVQYIWNRTINWIRSTFWGLEMLLTGKAGVQDMSGPVGIVQMMGQVADESPTVGIAILSLLQFGAYIAVNLAVMNLLPIPALDGGRVVALLLTTVFEAITHKKLDPKYEGYLHAVGMVLLLGLMAVIMLKDIIFIFK
jgi:regulator of sigma E protease